MKRDKESWVHEYHSAPGEHYDKSLALLCSYAAVYKGITGAACSPWISKFVLLGSHPFRHHTHIVRAIVEPHIPPTYSFMRAAELPDSEKSPEALMVALLNKLRENKIAYDKTGDLAKVIDVICDLNNLDPAVICNRLAADLFDDLDNRIVDTADCN